MFSMYAYQQNENAGEAIDEALRKAFAQTLDDKMSLRLRAALDALRQKALDGRAQAADPQRS